MKKMITCVLPFSFFLSVSLQGQLVANKTAGNLTDNGATERKVAYTTKTSFNPGYEYDSMYAMASANPGMEKRVEQGAVKILSDNNRTAVVYYNYAAAGTVIRVTNPDNGKWINALVIGKMPSSQSKIYLLMIGEMAARELFIRDYSTIELSYYVPAAVIEQ